MSYTQEWLKQFGTSSDEYINAMATGADGSIYVAINRGSLENNDTVNESVAFLAKYDSNGNQTWMTQINTGNATYNMATKIYIDSTGLIYVGGYYNNLDGNGNIIDIYVFLATYNSSGSQTNFIEFKTTYTNYIKAMTVDSSGSIYVGGITGTNTIFLDKFDTAAQTQTRFAQTTMDSNIISINIQAITIDSYGSIYLGGYTKNEVNNIDGFVVKFDTTGTQSWLIQLGTDNTEDFVFSIAIGLDGYVYIGGATNGSLGDNGNTTSETAFLAKYDSNGNKIWIKQFGTNYGDVAGRITIGVDGSIYVGKGGNDSSSGIEMDTFVAKFDTNGNQTWINNFGSSLADSIFAMTTGLDGSIYAGGMTGGDLGGTNAGGSDVFITKYSETTNSETTTTLIGFRYSSNMIFSTKELRSFKPTMFSSEDAYSMSWKISPKQLPAGIEFNKRTGKIIGTPTAKFDEQTFTVFATSSDNISARYAFKMKCE